MKPSDASPELEREHEADLKRLRVTALRVLSRRDYGAADLQRKLEQKGFARTAIQQVLAGLASQGLLSDGRYAESFVRQHIARGQGPARIRAELRQRGITDDVVQAALSSTDTDWNSLAATVRRKRFGSRVPRTGTERAKQGRFLQYRGFDSDHVRAAFQAAASSLDEDSSTAETGWNDFPDERDSDED